MFCFSQQKPHQKGTHDVFTISCVDKKDLDRYGGCKKNSYVVATRHDRRCNIIIYVSDVCANKMTLQYRPNR